MQPHEERVVVEKRELDEKLSKLREFRMGKIYSTLDPVDRALLESQEGPCRSMPRSLDEGSSVFMRPLNPAKVCPPERRRFRTWR